ncbi:Probable outer membrane channel protein [gamma proteobacterium HdN1]|nr:Probable outer membrane channel protein [gamma proteobacterium HdN1]
MVYKPNLLSILNNKNIEKTQKDHGSMGKITAVTRIWLAFITAFFWCATHANAAEPVPPGYDDVISIVQGQTTLLPFPNVVRVSIGEENLANAQPAGANEILLTGLKAGVTDLRIWPEHGKAKRYLLKIIDNTWTRVLELSNTVLADIEGVSAREDNGIVLIEGRLLREQDAAVIADLKAKLKKEVKEGKVVFNVVLPNVKLAAMVMLDVHVVEVRKQDLKKLGVQWDSATAGPAYGVLGQFRGAGNFEKDTSVFGFLMTENRSPIKVGNGYIGTSIGSKLNFLQSNGVAHVLAQPKLVTRSGSEASFLAGGEIPIPTVTKDNQINTIFKQVGVILKISPKADPDGFIETAINVEVSQVDASVQVLGIPGFITRKTKMEMNVQSGQTMAISGMLSEESSKAIDKMPGLGSIPILGELFKSRDFRQNTTELMIFVTPYLVDPDSEQNKELLANSKKLDQNGKKEARRFSIMD